MFHMEISRPDINPLVKQHDVLEQEGAQLLLSHISCFTCTEIVGKKCNWYQEDVDMANIFYFYIKSK